MTKNKVQSDEMNQTADGKALRRKTAHFYSIENPPKRVFNL
jgi:hypothetical protein